jgi:hypothetical protein
VKKCVLIAFVFCAGLKAQVVPTHDSLRLLNQRIISWEILNIGAAMPISDFGSKDKSSTSGFAIPGIKIDAGYNIQLYRHLGIKTQLIIQSNRIDQTKYKKDLRAENPANSYTISSGAWNNFAFHIGVLGNFNLTSKVHLQPFLMGGFNMGTSPLIKINVLDSLGSSSLITQNTKIAANFSYSGGMDLKIDIAPHFQFTTGVDAFYSDLKFRNIRVDNTNNSVYEFTIVQSIQTLGFKAGITMLLN